jgi:uncharacterized protein YqcC (DUF446 family)
MPKNLPPIVKEYKHITLHGHQPGMVDTGIYLKKLDLYSIFAAGSINFGGNDPQYFDVRPELGWPLMARIGEKAYFEPYRGYNNLKNFASNSGNLYLGTRRGPVNMYGEPVVPQYYQYSSGTFSVDIIVWNREDWIQIADFFEKMKERNPQNEAIAEAVGLANYYQQIFRAESEASKEIAKTKKAIEALKGESEEERPKPVITTKEENITHRTKPISVDAEKQVRITQLEDRLAKLTETLAQLEIMKKELSASREKSSLLTKELDESKDLIVKLKEGSKSPPVIVIASPKDESKVEVNIIHVSGVAEDDQGLSRLEIYLNNKPVNSKADRGLRVTEGNKPKRVNISERITLEKGENQIRIRAVDSDGLWAEKILKIQKLEIRRNIWAVVIGINSYPNIRHLKYAVNDARAFYDYLVNRSHIPVENVTLLLDEDATLTKLRSTLGTHLKRKAGKDDMVIIYFAGHGSTEKDVMSPDGDGLEKYLLPYGADPKDLYASALPMREISHIFNRVRSERLVFLADSCYSGASGGRTIGITGVRSSLSNTFLDRVAGGKGRVIITASGANEVSVENDDIQHGVFTYYLIEGLKGKADMDKDGLITVDEAYRYVSYQVPRATGQEQHPVKKGTVEGRLILGVIE